MPDTLKRKEITLDFGVLGKRKVEAVIISSRMAVHHIIDHDTTVHGSYRVSDPVTGHGWPGDHKDEAGAIKWAQAFTAEFGDDPMSDAKVKSQKSGWLKKPARYQEIKEWIRNNPPQ